MNKYIITCTDDVKDFEDLACQILEEGYDLYGTPFCMPDGRFVQAFVPAHPMIAETSGAGGIDTIVPHTIDGKPEYSFPPSSTASPSEGFREVLKRHYEGDRWTEDEIATAFSKRGKPTDEEMAEMADKVAANTAELGEESVSLLFRNMIEEYGAERYKHVVRVGVKRGNNNPELRGTTKSLFRLGIEAPIQREYFNAPTDEEMADMSEEAMRIAEKNMTNAHKEAWELFKNSHYDYSSNTIVTKAGTIALGLMIFAVAGTAAFIIAAAVGWLP